MIPSTCLHPDPLASAPGDASRRILRRVPVAAFLLFLTASALPGFCQAGRPALPPRAAAAALSLAGTPTDSVDGGSGSWTLERCVRTAVENSAFLRTGSNRLEQARARAAQARGERLPSLALEAGYTHTSETMSLDLPLPSPPGPRRIEFGDGHAADLQLVLAAPLFTGGILSNREDAARRAQEAARHDLRADSLLVRRTARDAFYSALGAEARLEAARLALDRLDRHIHDLKETEETGMASEEQMLQARAERTRHYQQVLDLQAALREARLSLGRVLGIPEIEISPAGDFRKPILREPAGTVGPGIQDRPELKAMSARIEGGLAGVKAARGALFPSLLGRAALHYARPGIDMVTNDWMDYYTLGVGLKWSLWDWKVRSRRIEEARAARDEIRETEVELRRDLESALQRSRVAVEASRGRLETVNQRLEIEARRLELVQARLEAGMSTEQEYLDAQSDLSLTEQEAAAAEAALRRAESALLYATGR